MLKLLKVDSLLLPESFSVLSLILMTNSKHTALSIQAQKHHSPKKNPKPINLRFSIAVVNVSGWNNFESSLFLIFKDCLLQAQEMSIPTSRKSSKGGH